MGYERNSQLWNSHYHKNLISQELNAQFIADMVYW